MLKQHNNLSTPNDRRCAGGRADRRGSAIVLVLVSVVLMAILAATLLQVTRFERIPRPASNIDIVVESVIEEIANQLTDDLLDNNGRLFNINVQVSGGENANGAGDEPWDFPWTNIGPDGSAIPGYYGRQAELIDGSQVPVFGGAMDDTWLADSAPDFRATIPVNTIGSGMSDQINGVWRKISSINGVYLYGTGGTSDLSTVESPDEQPVNAMNSVLNRDMNIRTNDQSLVDADGDGIGDSRWEWAPIRQIGTTRYVMAVRVIDLSARMDVNVAMGRVTTNDNSAIRGDNPTEIDGDVFLTETATAGGRSGPTARNEWRDALNYRLSGTAPNPPALISAETRYDNNQANAPFPTRRHYWEEGASRVGPTFVRSDDVGRASYDANATFRTVDALELLHRNGLNSTSQSTLEQLMPQTLRHDDGVEEPFTDSRTRVTAQNLTQREFWENDIRKQITPFSGAAIHARPLPGDTQSPAKLDIHKLVDSSRTLTQLRTEIEKVLNTGNTTPVLRSRFPHFPTITDLAGQYAVNIADYIDDDNRVNILPNGSKLAVGFEVLPFISEVYTQRLYQVTAVQPPAAPATTDRVTWTAQGPQGYVIEIGNPFARYDNGSWVGRPVKLDGVWLKLYDGMAAVELSSLQGAPSELQPGEVLHVYRNSGGNSNDANMDDLDGYHPNISEGNFTTVHTARGPVYPAGRRNARISLHSELQTNAGSAAIWSYAACEIQAPAGSIVDNAMPGSFAVGDQGYAMSGYRGIGHGLPMMTVAAAAQSTGNTRGFWDDANSIDKPGDNSTDNGAPGTRPANRSGYTPELAKEDKRDAPNIFNSLKDQQIVWHDNPRKQMHWIGDLLQIPLIGVDPASPSNGATTAEAFYKAAGNSTTLNGGVNALMLSYKTKPATPPAEFGIPMNATPAATRAAIGGQFGLYNVPHAVMLTERLTTFSPATDGEDGDNDGNAADNDELLVPGKINLNTAPYHTLVRALPYPDLAIRQAAARAIVNRREHLRQQSTYGTSADNLPAIAYTGLLYDQIRDLPASPSQDGADTDTLNGARIDWNNYEDSPGVFPAGLEDGVIDDREEELMLAKWLNEVADTRSDVFAAYIVVQGYPAENFKGGVIESARLVVIFSRAGVQDEEDRAVEIGRFRFK